MGGKSRIHWGADKIEQEVEAVLFVLRLFILSFLSPIISPSMKKATPASPVNLASASSL